MKRYDGFLLCSDLDGTLTENTLISDENIQAIKYFQENGGIFTVATGRMPEHITKSRYNDLFSGFMIALNGTIIYNLDSSGIVWDCCLDSDVAEVLEYVFESYAFTDEVYFNGENNHLLANKKNFRALLENPIHTIVFCQNAKKTLLLKNELRKKFGNRYKFEQSWPEGLELYSMESGKGVCVEKTKELVSAHKTIHTTVCVGDFENDISMIKSADIGYAVGNATEDVKKAADRVTVHYTEAAIAKIIYEIA